MTQSEHLDNFSGAISAFTRNVDRLAFFHQTLESLQGEEHGDARKNIAALYMQRAGAMLGLGHIVDLPKHLFSDEDLQSFLTETVPGTFPQHKTLLNMALPAVGKNRKEAFALLRTNESFRLQYADIITPVERRVSAYEAIHASQ